MSAARRDLRLPPERFSSQRPVLGLAACTLGARSLQPGPRRPESYGLTFGILASTTAIFIVYPSEHAIWREQRDLIRGAEENDDIIAGCGGSLAE